MSVTTPAGFRAAGVAAGIRASGARDLALVVNDGPHYCAAGVFTSNRVKAAPVHWSQLALADGRLRAAVLNSGSANACTGQPGYADAVTTAERVAAHLKVAATDVAVCSTGLIGKRLPMPAVCDGIDSAIGALAQTGGSDAAHAIMTTDTCAKTATVSSGTGYHIGGMAKGAGMLAPSLATMLVVLTTDAVVPSAVLDKALRSVTGATFDRLDSDGCMSTNDTVLLLASGACGVTPSVGEFAEQLGEVCRDLTQQLLTDAEGSTKDITIAVTEAASEDDALTVGRAIARSNLLKCALSGNDPNWGRVLAAIGTTSAVFDPDRIDVAMGGVWVCRQGADAADPTTVDISGREVTIEVNLHAGSITGTVWTNDLTAAYVHENAAYST